MPAKQADDIFHKKLNAGGLWMADQKKAPNIALINEAIELDETVRKILTIAAAILAVAMIAGLILSSNILGYFIGLAIGAGVFALNLLLLRKFANKSPATDPDDVIVRLRLFFAYRYFITTGALSVFIVVPFIDVWGGAIGLFAPHLAFQLARF